MSALAARNSRVAVLSGEASSGIARQSVGELALLRDGVELIAGTEVAVVRSIALLEEGDTCLVIDLRRYDRWVLDAARRAGERGVAVVALTDSALSPIALLSDASFTVAAASAGPFDSHVATLAVLNALVTAVADKLRSSATDRLDRIEAAWRGRRAHRGYAIEPDDRRDSSQ